VRAGERLTVPFAGNLEADDSVPVVVVAISLIPSIDIQGVMVSALKAPVGLTTKIPGNPPAYYLDITIQWIRQDVVREGDIMFSVDEGWLKDQGIAPADLVMMQYHDKTWSELPTRMEKYSNGRYYYGATTSGFSYFAVTRKGAGASTTTPTLTSLATITQQIKSESTTRVTPRPVTSAVRTKPVTSPTTVPPVLPAESPEFPLIWIVFGRQDSPALSLFSYLSGAGGSEGRTLHCSGNMIKSGNVFEEFVRHSSCFLKIGWFYLIVVLPHACGQCLPVALVRRLSLLIV
jgi:PGF-pre-PGF domain-containing protein